MCEPEESNNSNQPPRSKELLMDLDDLDLDPSWSLDHIALVSNQMGMSPLVISSSSDQPCSPLWAFSDAGGTTAAAADDEKISSASIAPPLRLSSEYPLFFSCTSSSAAENTTENDNSRHFPSPFMGLIPLDDTDSYCLIKQRISQALRNFKESTEQHVLAQVWAPVLQGDRYVLTTSGQPFILDPHCNGLNLYRLVSLSYMFSVDSESDVELGLPGRVFRQKLPEWTPNVQYYSSREFSRLDHALNYNVRGTLALPVFGPTGQSCVGVVELIMTSEKIHYAPEVDKVCKALKAVNLKSSEILDHQTTQICNESRKDALAEIQEILTVVCETHKLPLAQTWVPCRHRSVLAYGGGVKKNCTSFDGSCMGQVCMSTTDVAVYVVDALVWGFREACLEHHLQKGQGVAGRAFLNRNFCFCRDVTQFCKTEYPLVHYARMFKLTSCFAICLQSSHTSDDDYILEFFLPPTITDKNEQDSLLGSLLETMKQHFQSLKVASGIELGENEVSVEIIEASTDKKVDSRIESIQIPLSVKSPTRPNRSPNPGDLQVNSPKLKLMLQNSDPLNRIANVNNVGETHVPALMEVKETKKPERKRGKTEKTISLEILQQYFAGSLKDAAKSLGVCPTTMKRICRQHGISRWPSRKINKVNRSLTKLKRVIESVQGTDGALDLTSLTSSPLPVAVGSISWPANPNFNGTHQLNSPDGSKPPEPYVPKNDSPNGGSPTSDPPIGVEEQLIGSKLSSQQHNLHGPSCLPELLSNNGSKRTKTWSCSKEESVGTPTSHGSCEGSPISETKVLVQERCFTLGGGSPELPFQPSREIDLSSAFSVANPILAAIELKEPFGGMLIEDAGSSKDLRNLCSSVADERFPESSCANPVYNNSINILPTEVMGITRTIPRVSSRPEMKSITIKASYREDIIRFRISLCSGIVELREEVAKRLKLEMGTFDIKYLDDDQELVLIACDADLQECLDISRSSGSNMVRLSVHDVMANLGSSCESTGEL